VAGTGGAEPVPIAASCGLPGGDVLVLAAPNTPTERSRTMPTEAEMQAIRNLGAPQEVTEDKAVAWLLSFAETLSDSNDTCSTQLSAAEAQLQELSAAKARIQELSAAAPRTSPEDVADYLETVAEKRETAVMSGAVSEAQAKMFDALLSDADGNPNVLALSAHGTGPDRRRFGVKFWKTVAKLAEGKDGAVRTGNAVERGVTAARPPVHLSHGQDAADEPPDAERVKELLAATTLGTAVLSHHAAK
jgi:hypothetical protein